ncbi:MAG: hypothetical protein EXS35_04780 [Pedosphaera sp.]|nr:hypothetical protein [Pedosphaera sp.]
MTLRASISNRFALPALGLALALVSVAQGATTNVTSPGKTNAPAASTNAAPAEIPLPRSVFVLPTKPSEGRNPFFPKSTITTFVTTKPAADKPVSAIADLKLGGLSGTVEHPLAIINGVTFGKGDENTVPVPSGRVRVLCIEIRLKDEIVVVEANGERKELKLRAK